MEDPNITIGEYIRLEEEKARRRGKVYNWETATYGKIWDNEDVHDLGSVETEFLVIVFNDTLTSEATLSCEPTVSSLNDEIDFRILFDESDDDDCLISQLAQQHIDEFDLKDEKSLSEYNEEEQNVLCFNDLFPFNVIYPDDSKSDKDNDDDKIDIEQSSGNFYAVYTAYSLYGRYPVFIFSTVYTTYSLNEYSVYRYQYDVSWGMDTVYQLLDLEKEKSTNIDGEFKKSGEPEVLES
ncbi:hypothetical protein Tco_0599654 [Tanacetum coccineum]